MAAARDTILKLVDDPVGSAVTDCEDTLARDKYPDWLRLDRVRQEVAGAVAMFQNRNQVDVDDVLPEAIFGAVAESMKLAESMVP